MKKLKKDVGFAWIVSSNKVNGNLIRIFKNAFLLNKRLFGRDPGKFRIIFCETEKEFKKESRYYYHKWGSATVLRDNTLVTRSPEFIEKIGRWKRKDFPNIVGHEMNHVFWNDFYKRTTKPVWLLEGFACYTGKNFVLGSKEIKKIIKKYNIDYSIIQYRYLDRNFRKGHFPIYPVWAAFTRYIADKYGAKSIVRLMDNYSKNLTRENYDRIFRKVFKITEKELLSQFLKKFK